MPGESHMAREQRVHGGLAVPEAIGLRELLCRHLQVVERMGRGDVAPALKLGEQAPVRVGLLVVRIRPLGPRSHAQAAGRS